MTKNFYKNRFYSWLTVFLFVNMLVAGFGAQDVRYVTIAIMLLIGSLIQDMKAYVARQLAEHEESKKETS